MRPYIFLYLALLLPISLLIALLFIFYFSLDYNFTQSITLGVLYGLFSGVFVSFIVLIALVILRKGQKSIPTKRTVTKKEKNTHEENTEIQQTATEGKNIHTGIDHKLMLLINKELTFGIILTSIKNHFFRSITTHSIEKGTINVKVHGEIISIVITPLTKHTSQVVIHGISNSEYIQNIISFLKEKENSFLQY